MILVTGGSGLVGKAVEEVLQGNTPANEKWIFATSKDADLISYDSAKAMFEKYRPTHVLHLAARVGGLFSNMKYKVRGVFRVCMLILHGGSLCMVGVQACHACYALHASGIHTVTHFH